MAASTGRGAAIRESTWHRIPTLSVTWTRRSPQPCRLCGRISVVVPAAPVAIAAAEATAAERSVGAIEELIIAAAMIGTIRTRRETFVGAVIAKARWQLPGILPIDPNDLAAIGAANVNYPARYVSRAGS